jgi:hypothetical protein
MFTILKLVILEMLNKLNQIIGANDYNLKSLDVLILLPMTYILLAFDKLIRAYYIIPNSLFMSILLIFSIINIISVELLYRKYGIDVSTILDKEDPKKRRKARWLILLYYLLFFISLTIFHS